MMIIIIIILGIIPILVLILKPLARGKSFDHRPASSCAAPESGITSKCAMMNRASKCSKSVDVLLKCLREAFLC